MSETTYFIAVTMADNSMLTYPEATKMTPAMNHVLFGFEDRTVLIPMQQIKSITIKENN